MGSASPGAYASSCEEDDDEFLDPITSETISDPVLCRSDVQCLSLSSKKMCLGMHATHG